MYVFIYICVCVCLVSHALASNCLDPCAGGCGARKLPRLPQQDEPAADRARDARRRNPG